VFPLEVVRSLQELSEALGGKQLLEALWATQLIDAQYFQNLPNAVP
jgi:hypothetical protein